jgi:hypothetical protein
MKRIRFATIIGVSVFSLAFSAQALTFDDLIGVYICKRTESTPTGVIRYDEIQVYKTDGTVSSYIYRDGVFIQGLTATVELAETGRFSATSDEAVITLHGKHLEITAEFPQVGTTVHIEGHRSDKLPHWLK